LIRHGPRLELDELDVNFKYGQSWLSPWAQQAVEHWRKYRPKYAQLFQSGELYERAEKAAQQTNKEYQNGITNGMLSHESWEVVRERYLFLPAEEDVPLLGENPNGYESC
jgi:hypothetical protein